MFSTEKAIGLNVKAVLWELSEVTDYIEALRTPDKNWDSYYEGYDDALCCVLEFLNSRVADYKKGDL